MLAKRLVVIFIAAGLIGGGILVPTAADAHSGSNAGSAQARIHCPSARTLFHALPAKYRRNVYKGGPRYGISSISCTARWATFGFDLNPGYAVDLLEHRRNGHWHELNRNRPCARHEVPRKIYVAACDAS